MNMGRYINSQGGKTGYWLSLLSLVAAGALLNLIPSPHQVGVDVMINRGVEHEYGKKLSIGGLCISIGNSQVTHQCAQSHPPPNLPTLNPHTKVKCSNHFAKR